VRPWFLGTWIIYSSLGSMAPTTCLLLVHKRGLDKGRLHDIWAGRTWDLKVVSQVLGDRYIRTGPSCIYFCECGRAR
jgi:hypothetical protein